ncbi:MAG: hypothetical protein FWC41_05960 [Firmicutes bacterium]|nr:hypothetical protein [Bacillota bacterium]
MTKINFKQKISVLLSMLVTTSGVFASNSKNLERVNTEKNSFPSESGNKSSLLSKRGNLVKKSYDEKHVVGILGLITAFGLIMGFYCKGKSKTAEEASGEEAFKDESKTGKGTFKDESKTEKGIFKVDDPEATVVVNNDLNINESNIGEIVKDIITNGKKLILVETTNANPLGVEVEDENLDSFYIFKKWRGRSVDLIVRLFNKDISDYNEKRKFYFDKLKNFNAERSSFKNNIYGIYQNAVIMRTCVLHNCDNFVEYKCGNIKTLRNLEKGKFLVDVDKVAKVYYKYEHHNWK